VVCSPHSPCVPHLNASFTREPAPLTDFTRIQLGDVGYILRGCFHFLFSTGWSPDGREIGVDVPRGFKQLEIGPTFNTQPRSPGCLPTNTVREIQTCLKASTNPYVLLHLFPPEPQTCDPGCLSPIPPLRSGSQEAKELPF